MSTLTKFSATPYTGPAPTNRDAYVPVEAAAAEARGQQIAAKVPNLRRILTHEDFQGHPLRKDYDPAQRWLLTEGGVAKLIPQIDERFKDVDTDFERVTLNLGPSHPATHGTLRIVVTLDGETIIGAEQEIGYLHRCFEKSCETHTYQQAIPFTDRLNYMSAIINNVGYCMTVEKLLGF